MNETELQLLMTAESVLYTLTETKLYCFDGQYQDIQSHVCQNACWTRSSQILVENEAYKALHFLLSDTSELYSVDDREQGHDFASSISLIMME